MNHLEIIEISKKYPSIQSFENIEKYIEGIICDLDELPRSEIKNELNTTLDMVIEIRNYYNSLTAEDYDYRKFLNNFEQVL